MNGLEQKLWADVLDAHKRLDAAKVAVAKAESAYRYGERAGTYDNVVRAGLEHARCHRAFRHAEAAWKAEAEAAKNRRVDAEDFALS